MPRVAHAATVATAQTTNISNAPICTAQFDQFGQSMVPDGSGNYIDVWTDGRNGNLDIYAQKLNTSGEAQWILDGVGVCKNMADQSAPNAVSDGAGGLIVVWQDFRSGTSKDIYAQRIDPFGTPLWTSNGVVVCNAANDQQLPVAVSDGVGGVIVAWTDDRAAVGASDVYAQRLNASGVPQWAANGVALCTAAGVQMNLTIATDANQGAYVAWQDQRAGAAGDIYAVRVNGAGVPQGVANGTPLCTQPGAQQTPVAVADGAGGVIVGWVDHRGVTNDIYAQRMNSAVQWTVDGVPVCQAAGDQTVLKGASDGVGGAFFVWQDLRGGANTDLYAQRVSPAGAAMWAVDGVPICQAVNDQLSPSIQRDPSGGALIAWSDNRSATSAADIFAQRINSSGSPLWTVDGVQLSDAPNGQDTPVLVADGIGGAFVAWHDARGLYPDLYGQEIDQNGVIGNQCVTPDTLVDNIPQVLTATQNYKFFRNGPSYAPFFAWGGIAVRGDPGSDWDIEGYDQGTWLQAPYPSCFGSSLAGSFGSGVVDLVMYDQNDNHVPPGVYGVRPFRYSGTGNGTAEFFGENNDIVLSTNAAPGTGVGSPANWTGVINVYDVGLTAGATYTFDFTRTPSDAPLTLLLFGVPVNTTDFYYVAPRSERIFETQARYYGYTSPTTDFYGIAVVNETGAPSQYLLRVWSDTPTTDVPGKGPGLTTGIQSVSPNPAHGRASIKFSLREAGDVSFQVLDMAGRVVSSIPSRHWQSGAWSIDWDGRSSEARSLSTGVYFVQMQVNGRRMGLGRVALIQ